jgi:hypothetical protein
MHRVGVILVSLAVLFSLSVMAFSAAGRRWHPILTVTGLTATLGVGLLLIIE